tara:strand:+ start:139 stop:471 length:333 start_codon:yes stop_codon:yes gene_type:complete
MSEWISGSYQMLESGSFEITRPVQIPLHTWTSSFNGLTTMKDDFNSGKWERITPYFTLRHSGSTPITSQGETVSGTPMYPSQSHVDSWAEDISKIDGINLSGSLENIQSW